MQKQAFLKCLSKGACRKIARLGSDGLYTISVIILIITALETDCSHPPIISMFPLEAETLNSGVQ